MQPNKGRAEGNNETRKHLTAEKIELRVSAENHDKRARSLIAFSKLKKVLHYAGRKLMIEYSGAPHWFLVHPLQSALIVPEMSQALVLGLDG